MIIDIRCPHCNRKVAETPYKSTVLEVQCGRCGCKYKLNNGKYSHEAPSDTVKRIKYNRFLNKDKGSYQDRMKLNKK